MSYTRSREVGDAMIKDGPSYAVVKSTKKIGFISPEDRPWEQVDIPINNSNFIKYNCECLSKHSGDKRESLEVILRPYCYPENRKKYIFYFGQCERCETIYWTKE